MCQAKANGEWLMSANQAFNDLNEALGYCMESGYRIYEADVREVLERIERGFD